MLGGGFVNKYYSDIKTTLLAMTSSSQCLEYVFTMRIPLTIAPAIDSDVIILYDIPGKSESKAWSINMWKAR